MKKNKIPLCESCKYLRPTNKVWCAKGVAFDTFLFECETYEHIG